MNRVTEHISALYARRWRGFRLVNVWAGVFAAALALCVYAFKADAGNESAKIRHIDQEIAEESRTVHLLQAEVAHLEQPDRLERLSVAYLGLQPHDARREAPVDGLMEVSHRVETPPHAPAGPGR